MVHVVNVEQMVQNPVVHWRRTSCPPVVASAPIALRGDTKPPQPSVHSNSASCRHATLLEQQSGGCNVCNVKVYNKSHLWIHIYLLILSCQLPLHSRAAHLFLNRSMTTSSLAISAFGARSLCWYGSRPAASRRAFFISRWMSTSRCWPRKTGEDVSYVASQ